METKYKKVVDHLNEILEKNTDAEKGYTKAAENATNIALKSFFNRKANHRMEFNENLIREMRSLYPDFKEKGSFTGDLHRTWMDIKAFFTGDNDEAMLEEAIRGDKAAVAEYEDILQHENLPVNISYVIKDQLVKIKADLSEVKTLEDLNK